MLTTLISFTSTNLTVKSHTKLNEYDQCYQHTNISHLFLQQQQLQSITKVGHRDLTIVRIYDEFDIILPIIYSCDERFYEMFPIFQTNIDLC